MFRKLASSCLIAAVCSVAISMPCFAQSGTDFFDSLQKNLPGSTSTADRVSPQQGSSETVVTTSSEIGSVVPYGAYDAGQDQWSGYIAGFAAVAAALVVAFALGFMLTHHHASEDQS